MLDAGEGVSETKNEIPKITVKAFSGFGQVSIANGKREMMS